MKTNAKPLIFINTPVNPATDLKFFITEVNRPARIIIIHCPNANKKNIAIDTVTFADNDANAMIVANIGEEHGVAAKANTIPTKSG